MSISQDEKERAIFRSRKKFQMNQASNMAIDNAEKHKELEIAWNMMKRNRSIEEIIEDTGLTREEVEGLRNIG